MLTFEQWVNSLSVGEIAYIDSNLSNKIDNELRENDSYRRMDHVNFPWKRTSTKEEYISDINSCDEALKGELSELIDYESESLKNEYEDYLCENMECV